MLPVSDFYLLLPLASAYDFVGFSTDDDYDLTTDGKVFCQKRCLAAQFKVATGAKCDCFEGLTLIVTIHPKTI